MGKEEAVLVRGWAGKSPVLWSGEKKARKEGVGRQSR